MAKTFNDIFPNGKGFVAKPGRRWKSVLDGRNFIETDITGLDSTGHLYCTVDQNGVTKLYAPYIFNLELIEEPTGREAIHAALDAYLDAKEKYDKADAVFDEAASLREKRLAERNDADSQRYAQAESLKKLLNL